MSIRCYEQPLPPGHVYPTTTGRVEETIRRFPPGDVEGIRFVRLVPSTRRDHDAYARYWAGDEPSIEIFSWPTDLRHKQPQGVTKSEVLAVLSAEISFGMQVEQVGRRCWISWDAESLERFMLEHVLAHEIGHHVYYAERAARGLRRRVRSNDVEQFAEHYALRSNRART